MGDHHKAAFEKAKRDVALFAVLKPVVLKRETRPGEHAVRIVEAEAVLRARGYQRSSSHPIRTRACPFDNAQLQSTDVTTVAVTIVTTSIEPCQATHGRAAPPCGVSGWCASAAMLAFQVVVLFTAQLKERIVQEAFLLSLHGAGERPGFNAVGHAKVRIEDHFFTADRLSSPPSRTGWYHGSLAHPPRVSRATRPTHSPATHSSPPLSRGAGSQCKAQISGHRVRAWAA